MIITKVEGKKFRKNHSIMGFKTIYNIFQQQDNGGKMSAFYALIKDAKDETYAFQIEDSCQ